MKTEEIKKLLADLQVKLLAEKITNGILCKVFQTEFDHLEEINRNLEGQIATIEALNGAYKEKTNHLERMNALKESLLEKYKKREETYLPLHLRLEKDEQQEKAA